MDCPVVHFPLPNAHSDVETKQLFEDYGRLTGVFPVVKDDGITLQFHKSRNSGEPVLCANGPILPLLSPIISLTDEEPCLTRLKQSLEEAKQFTRTIRHLQKENVARLKEGTWDYLVSGRPSRLQKTMKTLTGIAHKFKDDPFMPVVNKRYTGGCASVVETSDTQFLCIPTAQGLDSLALYELKTDGRLEAKHVTSTKASGQIWQVEAGVVNESCFFGARSEKDCVLYSLRYKEDGIQFKRKKKLKFNSRPLSISLSPYIFGECVTVARDGSLQLWDANGSAASENGSVTQRFTEPEFWANAAYSAHPRQVLVTDRTGVAVWDMRMSARSEDIFVLPNSSLGKDERIMTSQPHPGNPFYHIISTAQTLLCLDHRFPKLPVLQWQHMAAAPPQYVNIVPKVLSLTGDDVILASTQDHAETIAYQINMSTSGLPPVSKSVPWRMAKPEDLFGLEGILSAPTGPQLDKRITAPLIGVAATRNKNNSGFSTVQLTSYGDLFGQKYVTGTSEREKTWCSGPGSSHLPLSREDKGTAERWHKQVLELVSEMVPLSSEMSVSKMSDATLEPHSYITSDSSGEDDVVKHLYRTGTLKDLLPALTDKRRSYHLVSPSFSSAVNEGKAIPNPIDEETVDAHLNFSTFDADQERFVSAKSQIVIRLWGGEELDNLIEQRESERAKDKQELEETKRREQLQDKDERQESGLDETDAATTETQEIRTDTRGSVDLDGPEVVHMRPMDLQRHESDDDSDMSSELECPDLSGTETIGQCPSDAAGLKGTKLMSSVPLSVDGVHEPTTPKRVRLSSESDLESPLKMFRHLGVNPSNSTERVKRDISALDSSFNFPFKTPTKTPLKTPSKTQESQKKRRSVMGF